MADGKYPGFIERTKAKLFNDDIRLPNDTGDRDTRLPKSTPFEDARRGLDRARTALQGLKNAGPKTRR